MIELSYTVWHYGSMPWLTPTTLQSMLESFYVVPSNLQSKALSTKVDGFVPGDERLKYDKRTKNKCIAVEEVQSYSSEQRWEKDGGSKFRQTSRRNVSTRTVELCV